MLNCTYNVHCRTLPQFGSTNIHIIESTVLGISVWFKCVLKIEEMLNTVHVNEMM